VIRRCLRGDFRGEYKSNWDWGRDLESREDEQRAARGLPWLRSPRLTEEPSLDYFFDAFSLVQTMVFIEQTFFLLLTDLSNRKIIS
jgi:hypothetical protein